ncbi:hypothetical protein [Limosilactobacillus reuteri]|uniref:hypothetical protein n=1 Tax=Limosilactobacillus reuteri TaxID=1598 RepID=UPI001CDD186D|nr:hypothetical protein [Limosilactobacillus reuteri]
MNNKLFQWFYNMPKLTNQDNKDYMAKISLNIAVSLFLFNLVAVLISFFIVTTTENYELSFNILAGGVTDLYCLYCWWLFYICKT